MTQPPPVQRTPAGLAFLDDARKRRKRRRPKDPPQPVALERPEPDDEDRSGYALDLAVDLLDGDGEPAGPAGSADEILAEHEAVAEAPATPADVDERGNDAPADEILLALEAHHQRAEPRQRHVAPRGSADLDVHQAQRARGKPTPRPTFKRPRSSRRLLAGGAIAAALAAIAIASNGAGAGTTSSAVDHPLAATANVGAATLAAGNYPSHGLLLAVHHQITAKTRTRRHVHHTSAPPKRPTAPHHTAAAAVSSRPSPNATGTSSAASSTPATAASSGSTPTASDPQSSSSSSGTSSPQPAGPAGTGGTVGGNCDPKCS